VAESRASATRRGCDKGTRPCGWRRPVPPGSDIGRAVPAKLRMSVLGPSSSERWPPSPTTALGVSATHSPEDTDRVSAAGTQTGLGDRHGSPACVKTLPPRQRFGTRPDHHKSMVYMRAVITQAMTRSNHLTTAACFPEVSEVWRATSS
jgi:hypothetical protein